MKNHQYLIKVAILGLIMRLIIMPFFYHPDIKVYNFQAHYLSEGVLDIYSS